ncbi:hypothetical protein MLD38_000472 [Melastoma candidum]|uniref:Uncharacterized protein n=1 Tax=Melastoma candidum TaxID=119954 RepID=A0ACB9S9I8_9MYRT|nr:hypothetical protein MLD38_000472 [Melastoma candidum]
MTFTVGGLSVINAIADAYSENLPVICIELRCFQTVTCYQAVVNNLEEAHEQIDKAVSTALGESKPVYISISVTWHTSPDVQQKTDSIFYFRQVSPSGFSLLRSV